MSFYLQTKKKLKKKNEKYLVLDIKITVQNWEK